MQEEIHLIEEQEPTNPFLEILANPFKCEVCGAAFSRKAHLESHSLEHNGIQNYECDLCDAVFKNKSGLRKHRVYHNGIKNFVCSVCQKTFLRKINLQIHMRIHTGERPYKCEICSATFRQKSGVYDHTNVVHLRKKPFECQICGFATNTKRGLLRHSFVHLEEKPYKCDVCGTGFSSKTSLKAHSRFHSGEKPFKCLSCDLRFRKKRELKKHNLVHSVVLQNLKEKTRGSFKWSDKSTRYLLTLIEDKKAYVQLQKKKKREVWESIATAMSEKGYALTWKAVFKMWTYLRGTYKSITSKQRRGINDGTTWMYYNIIAEMTRNISNSQPKTGMVLRPRKVNLESLSSSSMCYVSDYLASEFDSCDSVSLPSPGLTQPGEQLDSSSFLQEVASAHSTVPPPAWFLQSCKKRERSEKEWRSEFRTLMAQRTSALQSLTDTIYGLIESQKQKASL